MPKTIKGWLMFGASVFAVIWVINNVGFLSNLAGRKLSA